MLRNSEGSIIRYCTGSVSVPNEERHALGNTRMMIVTSLAHIVGIPEPTDPPEGSRVSRRSFNDLRGSHREINHLTYSSIDRLYDITKENAYNSIGRCIPRKDRIEKCTPRDLLLTSRRIKELRGHSVCWCIRKWLLVRIHWMRHDVK